MKLVCKYCGHDKFKILNMSQSQCNRCLKLMNSMDDFEEKKPDPFEKTKDEIVADALTYHMRIVGRINILKKRIDKALDNGEESNFYRLTNELNHLERLLEVDKEGSINN